MVVRLDCTNTTKTGGDVLDSVVQLVVVTSELSQRILRVQMRGGGQLFRFPLALYCLRLDWKSLRSSVKDLSLSASEWVGE